MFSFGFDGILNQKNLILDFLLIQGYHKAANLGELRNNHDACCTYEGDNNVLGQQTSNYLVRQWESGVENPSGTAEFIDRRDTIMKYTFEKVRDQRSLDSIECRSTINILI